MSKPIVHFKQDSDDFIKVGSPAFIIKVIDHPSDLVSNTKVIHTSNVVAINEDGFETENTIYRKLS